MSTFDSACATMNDSSRWRNIGIRGLLTAPIRTRAQVRQFLLAKFNEAQPAEQMRGEINRVAATLIKVMQVTR